MSGFRVALPNLDVVDSWMVKNRLYPTKIYKYNVKVVQKRVVEFI